MTHQYSSKEKREKKERKKSLLEPKQNSVVHTCHTTT
jgi:hypothetical protein